MSVDTQSTFTQLQTAMEEGGVAACLKQLVEQLEAENKLQELFEARKMQVRLDLGLPLLSNELPADLGDEQRREIEDKLIDRYREVYRDVGLLMFKSGHLGQGWMLLQAAGEEDAARRELEAMDVHEEIMDEFIDVALRQGVAPMLGFAAVLEHYGTCNAITTYDQAMYGRPLADRQAAAGMLIDHLHEELMATLKADIAQQQGSEPPETTLRELVADRDWLFSDGGYHIDTTHLASTIRFARCLEDEAALRKAIDLTEYGRRLEGPFQHEGEEPFKDIYRSHALLFHAFLGERVDEALDYFRTRAEEVDIAAEGSTAAETYIALLDRTGRPGEAAAATVKLIPPGIYTQGLAPTLFELCEKTGDFTPLIEACADRDDLLGFAAGLIQSKLNET